MPNVKFLGQGFKS